MDVEGPTYSTVPLSFARRGGRLTERRQKAWDDLAGTHVLDIPRAGSSTSVDPAYRLDVAATFGRRAPLVVEIGVGRGEAIVQAALDEPEVDFLGLEVYVPGVAQTLVTMRHAGVSNVRLVVVNAPEALTSMIAPASLRELRMWFPDPWHKVRHHKRRLVTPAFASIAAAAIEPGGVWRLATDWQDYADQMREVLQATPEFACDGWSPRFPARPVTRFESKGLDAGRTIRDLTAVRRRS